MVAFDDYDKLSRVVFDEATFERTQFVRGDVNEQFRVKCVELLAPEYLLREIGFWRRYTKTKGRT